MPARVTPDQAKKEQPPVFPPLVTNMTDITRAKHPADTNTPAAVRETIK
jgi:hypothetical protein